MAKVVAVLMPLIVTFAVLSKSLIPELGSNLQFIVSFARRWLNVNGMGALKFLL